MESRELNYNRIADLMLREAVTGNIASFSRLSPERELAEKYNCSRVTIRKALEVLEQRKCISKIERQGTFWVDIADIPDEIPAPKNWRIAVVIFNFGFQHGLLHFLDGLEHAGNNSRNDLTSIWHINTASCDTAEEFTQLNEVDGYIVTGDFRLADLSWFINTRKPMVVVGQAIDRTVTSIDQRPFSLIRMDVRRGWEMAAEHLIESGRTHPAILVASRHQGYIDRRDGVLAALDRAGLPRENCQFIAANPETDQGQISPAELYAGVERMLDLPHCDCLLTTVEPVIIVVAAQKRGISLTQLFPIIAECNQGDLTPQFFGIDTISDDMGNLGRQSVNALLELLHGTAGYKVVNIPPHLTLWSHISK